MRFAGYICPSQEDCLYLELSGSIYGICVECYNAVIPEEVTKNDIYSENEYDENQLFIHRKVMVSLARIS